MKLSITALVIGSVGLLVNCRSDKFIPGICFEENILPLFVSHCASNNCHGGINPAAEYNCTTYESIMKKVVPGHPLKSKAFTVINGKKTEMPPDGHNKLSREEVDRIKSWIAFGAKNSIDCVAVCDTLSCKFEKDVKPIITSWCYGCHSASTAGGGVVLSDYNTIKVVAANGKLSGTIHHAAGSSAMPLNASKLSDCKIKIIQKWIDSGYPDN